MSGFRLKKLLLMVGLLFGLPLFSAPKAIDVQQLSEKAKQGDAWAQLNYGAAFDHGLSGIPENVEKAVYWYEKSARQGVAEAQFNYGHCLATGHGTAQNYQQAFFWLNKAADQGMADAQFLVAIMYKEGLGVAVDHKRFNYWLQKAAMQDNEMARELLLKIGKK